MTEKEKGELVGVLAMAAGFAALLYMTLTK